MVGGSGKAWTRKSPSLREYGGKGTDQSSNVRLKYGFVEFETKIEWVSFREVGGMAA